MGSAILLKNVFQETALFSVRAKGGCRTSSKDAQMGYEIPQVRELAKQS